MTQVVCGLCCWATVKTDFGESESKTVIKLGSDTLEFNMLSAFTLEWNSSDSMMCQICLISCRVQSITDIQYRSVLAGKQLLWRLFSCFLKYPSLLLGAEIRALGRLSRWQTRMTCSSSKVEIKEIQIRDLGSTHRFRFDETQSI